MDLLPQSIELFAAPIEGIIERPIALDHPGRVKALGTTWNAHFHPTSDQPTITTGDRVLVIGRRGITLLVIPLTK